MNKTKILNFSLGPVQGFIARARKTRDFWTGSFMLSYLVGQAMATVLENRGSLILPAVARNKDKIDDPLLQAIVEHKSANGIVSSNRDKPTVATLPNRFRAKVPADFTPDLCKQAIEKKWKELAAITWERYLSKPAALGNATREIWQRQIEGYWEINWILSEDSAALDLRKNWRSHLPSIEPGDKCTLFGDLQELSGYLRIREKNKQDRFWEAMRQQKQTGIFYDLEENERLCSIALIKRFFPYVAPEIIFGVPTGYPSTPYLSAVNWIASVIETKTGGTRDYAKEAAQLPAVRGRENPDLFPILQEKLAIYPQAREFATLDGNCFFKAALENSNLWDSPSSPASETEKLRKELVDGLEKLGSPSSPFYAMLLMDGDSLGALLQQYKDKADLISSALHRFSLGVPLYIKENNGITVFAGGDDVLALLPLENALAAATALHRLYRDSFGDKIPQATISGAIVYAHHNTPLTEVYHEAQHLLTDVAKEETGRDSLAFTVWKSVGKVLTWSAPWEIVGDKFIPFLQNFQTDLPGEKKLKEFSNSFFYNIQSRLALFTEKKASPIAFSTADLQNLLTAEYIKSRGPETEREKAVAIMEQLLELCRPHWRNLEGKHRKDKNSMQMDSLFLIKFLVEKGV